MNYSKILKIVLSSLIALLLIIFFVLPYSAKIYLNNNGKELVGRKLSIDKFRLNIFNGKSELIDFKMYEDNDSSIFVQFDTLQVDLAIKKIFKHELEIEKLVINKPSVALILTNKVFNFSTLSGKDSSNSVNNETVKDTVDKKPFFNKYTLNNFKINNGHIGYINNDDHSDHDIKDLSISLKHISWGENDSDTALEFNLEEGGHFTTSTNFDSETGAYVVDLEVRKIKLPQFLPEVNSFIILSDLQGSVDADLKISGNINHLEELAINGAIVLKDLLLSDNKDLDLLTIKQIKLKIRKFELNENIFDIASLEIDGANAVFQQYDTISNLNRLFIVESQKAIERLEDSVKVKEDKILKWEIEKLELKNSQLYFSDYSLKPNIFKYKLTDINFKAKKIAIGNRVKFKLSAITPEDGHLSADVTTDIGNVKDGQFDISIKNVNIKDFSPYSITYFGYPMTRGRLNFVVKNKVENNYIKSLAIIDTYYIELDKKDKDIEAKYDVPLKTALSISQDKKHHIHLEIPMEGNLNDPDFALGKKFVHILSNMLIKIAYSPFKILSKGLGINDEKIKKIEFETLQFKLQASQTAQLNIITDMLKKKYPLKVVVQLKVNVKKEKQELLENMAKSHYYLQKTYNNDTLSSEISSIDYRNIIAIELKDKEFNKYLCKKLNVKKGDLKTKEMCKMIVKPAKVDQYFESINKSRIDNVKKYFSKISSINYEVKPKYEDYYYAEVPFLSMDYIKQK